MKCLTICHFPQLGFTFFFLIYTKPKKPPPLLFPFTACFFHNCGHVCTVVLLQKADFKCQFAHLDPLYIVSLGILPFSTKPAPFFKNENVAKSDWLGVF